MKQLLTHLFCLFLWALSLSSLSGQASDIEKLRADFNAIVFEDLDSAQVIAKRMVDLAPLSDTKPYALAQHTMGNYHLFASQYTEALSFYRKALTTYQKIGNWKDASGILINMASCEAEMGFLDAAMAFHDRSLRIQDSLNISGGARATNQLNLGILHFELKDYPKALQQYRAARKSFSEMKDTFAVAECDYNIALLLSDIDSMEAAMSILKDLEVYHTAGQHNYKLNMVLLELGRNYRIQGERIKAKAYIDRGLDLAQADGDLSMIGLAYNKLSDWYKDADDWAQAERYAQLSYEAALENQDRNDQLVDLQSLSSIYEARGDYQKALAYHQSYVRLHDSIQGTEQLTKIANLSAKYELDKKEQTIQLLHEKEKRNEVERNGLILLILSLLGVGFSITIALRQRLKAQRLLKDNAELTLQHSQEKASRQEQELAAYALQLASKNQFLEDIKQDVSSLEVTSSKQVQRIVNTIHVNQLDETSWEEFRDRFRAVHKDFERHVKERYPVLSANEMRLMILLRMSLNSREIAHILNISMDGIKKARYRLRKKLQLSTADSLEELVLGL